MANISFKNIDDLELVLMFPKNIFELQDINLYLYSLCSVPGQPTRS